MFMSYVVLYKKPNGRCPIYEFLSKDLRYSKDEHDLITYAIKKAGEEGLGYFKACNSSQFKKIKGFDNLYEFRVGRDYRILFSILKESQSNDYHLLLLMAFKKKNNKATEEYRLADK